MGEIIDVDRAFWNPYSEETATNKEQAQRELEEYLESRPCLDRWGNLRHPETNNIIIKKIEKQERDPRTNRLVGAESVDDFYDNLNDPENVRSRSVGTPYDHMAYDNMTPVQLAKCEALARRDGETAKADKLREIRHERVEERVAQDKAKRPETFDSSANNAVFSNDAYTAMSDKLVDTYARKHPGQQSAERSGEPVVAAEQDEVPQAADAASAAASADSAESQGAPRVRDEEADRAASSDSAAAESSAVVSDTDTGSETPPGLERTADHTETGAVVQGPIEDERGSGRVRVDRDPEEPAVPGPGIAAVADRPDGPERDRVIEEEHVIDDGSGSVGGRRGAPIAGAVAADRGPARERDTVVEEDRVVADGPGVARDRRGAPVAAAVSTGGGRTRNRDTVIEEDVDGRREPFYRRWRNAPGIGALAVGGSGSSGGWRDRISSWRSDRYERRGGFGRAVLIGALACAFAWLALDEISEQHFKIHGDKITIVEDGHDSKITVKKPKIKVNAPEIKTPDVKTPDVDKPEVTVTPDTDDSTNDNGTNNNQTGGTEYEPGNTAEDNDGTNAAGETPAQERAEERIEARDKHTIAELRRKLAAERHEGRARATSLASRTYRLRPGGNIWSNVHRYEAGHGYPHGTTAVRSVTQSVLNRKGISWGDAHHLPVGYKFTIPASALQHLR